MWVVLRSVALLFVAVLLRADLSSHTRGSVSFTQQAVTKSTFQLQAYT